MGNVMNGGNVNASGFIGMPPAQAYMMQNPAMMLATAAATHPQSLMENAARGVEHKPNGHGNGQTFAHPQLQPQPQSQSHSQPQSQSQSQLQSQSQSQGQSRMQAQANPAPARSNNGVLQQQQQQQPQQAAKRFAHQEASTGKHIIVDIADTALEVFPFAKIAKRHHVSVEKVRNIFEAVVAIPFLRIPADKRRAGKVGQERVKKYVMTKRELEKQKAASGNFGGSANGQPSMYEMARAMGPSEAPKEWAQGTW